MKELSLTDRPGGGSTAPILRGQHLSEVPLDLQQAITAGNHDLLGQNRVARAAPRC